MWRKTTSTSTGYLQTCVKVCLLIFNQWENQPSVVQTTCRKLWSGSTKSSKTKIYLSPTTNINWVAKVKRQQQYRCPDWSWRPRWRTMKCIMTFYCNTVFYYKTELSRHWLISNCTFSYGFIVYLKGGSILLLCFGFELLIRFWEIRNQI